MKTSINSRFHPLLDSIVEKLGLPRKFNYPFNYRPHPLVKYAAEDLQRHLEKAIPLKSNFDRKGKMFGVLIAENSAGKIGYFAAFSGYPDSELNLDLFVPPVFNLLREKGFFKKKEKLISEINREIDTIENDTEFLEIQIQIKELETAFSDEFKLLKTTLSERKSNRKVLRKKELEVLTTEDYKELLSRLAKESNEDRRTLKAFKQRRTKALSAVEKERNRFLYNNDKLRKERKEKSRKLQEELFEAYSFLNRFGNTRNLKEIFSATSAGRPPAAAGDCCLPRLLQYCFTEHFTPLAFGEFWWGNPPKSEIRQHKNFYPACRGRCKPILSHMLEGIETDGDPLLIAPDKNLHPVLLFEDDSLLIVEKPEGLLSVPGRLLKDSVYIRLKEERKGFEPLMLHRLDMHTSGLMVVAKTKEAHKAIQKQFLRNEVIKEYTALLSKKIKEDAGDINLPLIADWMHRPRQRVDFEIGKQALTRFKVIEKSETQTRILFWPVTGRTHQLRVHAAHPSGLGAPIPGDDLYGIPGHRLYLHASGLEFTHPVSGKRVKFKSAVPF